MNYKFAFVLAESNDYIRKVDLSYMTFIEEAKQKFPLKFEADGILYLEEDVNMARSEKLQKLLEENKIKCEIVTAVKWKEFPKLQVVS